MIDTILLKPVPNTTCICRWLVVVKEELIRKYDIGTILLIVWDTIQISEMHFI